MSRASTSAPMSESFEKLVRIIKHVKISRHSTYFAILFLRRKDTRDAVIVQSAIMAQPRAMVAMCCSVTNSQCYVLFRKKCGASLLTLGVPRTISLKVPSNTL